MSTPNTRGFNNGMRVFMVTLGYAPARVLLACLDQVYQTIGVDVEHHLLNNHYPVDMVRNDTLVESICKAYKIRYHDLGHNSGLSGGYNYLIANLRTEPDDIIIGLDPDTFPVTPNWGRALVSVLQQDKRIAWASLMNPPAEPELKQRGYVPEMVGGELVWHAQQACVNSICAWRAGTLQELGGLQEPKKYYGGIESMMFPMVKRLGLSWAYLPEYREECSPLVESHPLYRKYKQEYALKNSTQDDFATWLKKSFV